MDSNNTKSSILESLPTSKVIIMPASTLMLLFTVYGIYIVVFGLSVRAFVNKRDKPPPKLYLWGTISLFVLDTIFVIFDAMRMVHQQEVYFEILKTLDLDRTGYMDYIQDRLKAISFGGAAFTMVLMMIIADSMLIHRCHVVWGFRRSILYPLVTISIIVNGALLLSFAFPLRSNKAHPGLVTEVDSVTNGIVIGAAVFNFLLTLMTVGRIWNIALKAQKIIEKSIRSRYNTIMAVIIESGILFPSVLLAAVVMALVMGTKKSGPVPIDLSALSTQISGLAPTMIIVRVAYSKPIEDVQEMVSTLRFENSEQQRARSTIV